MDEARRQMSALLCAFVIFNVIFCVDHAPTNASSRRVAFRAWQAAMNS